jgi:hypothetical protein
MFYLWNKLPLVAKGLPLRIEASKWQPPFIKRYLNWFKLLDPLNVSWQQRCGSFDPWCLFELLISMVSQNHPSCFGAIWPKLCWCTVKTNKQTNKQPTNQPTNQTNKVSVNRYVMYVTIVQVVWSSRFYWYKLYGWKIPTVEKWRRYNMLHV